MTYTTRAPGEPDRSIAEWSLRAWIEATLGKTTADRIHARAEADGVRLQDAFLAVVAAGLDRKEQPKR